MDNVIHVQFGPNPEEVIQRQAADRLRLIELEIALRQAEADFLQLVYDGHIEMTEAEFNELFPDLPFPE